MLPNCSPPRCATCGGPLPRGVRVALFDTPEATDAVLGDFCSVAHAFQAIDGPSGEVLPDALYLGVRIDRADHDEDALAAIMAEVVRRAVRAAMQSELAANDDARPSSPANLLN